MEKGKAKVPEFGTAGEEAEFWETRSPLDYAPEPRFQELRALAPKDKTITIRLDTDYRSKLERAASAYGMGPSTLARWIIANWIDAFEKLGPTSGHRAGGSVPESWARVLSSDSFVVGPAVSVTRFRELLKWFQSQYTVIDASDDRAFRLLKEKVKSAVED